jgi:hypothetical protein
MGWRERLGLGPERADGGFEAGAAPDDKRTPVPASGAAGKSQYYAVNDRPVELVETAEGLDCLVLDLRTGNMHPDRSYFARLEPGIGKDVDKLDEAAFNLLLGAHRADRVRSWAEQLCSAPGTTMDDLVATLGVPTSPPPLGAAEVDLDDRFDPTIELWLTHGAPARRQLDARLGAAEELVRIHWDSYRVLQYHVAVPGAALQVTVTASFPWDHGDATGARSLSLSLHPPRPVPAMRLSTGDGEPIPCLTCRTVSEPGTAFCGHCGTFLEW